MEVKYVVLPPATVPLMAAPVPLESKKLNACPSFVLLVLVSDSVPLSVRAAFLTSSVSAAPGVPPVKFI